MKLDLEGRYNLDLVLPIGLLLLAEYLIFLGNMKAAMTLHALNILLLILSSIYLENKIYSVLMLLPLFRLLNVAMPVFFNLTIYSYSLVYAPMFIPIYYLMREKVISISEAGITPKGFLFYLPLAIVVGFALGWGESNVLHAGALIPDIDLKDILILSLTMTLFVGVVEEFMFRSALQTVLEQRLGSIGGLLVCSIIFGIMHSGYRLPSEVFYVSFAGVVFGLLFWLTKSLPIIALAHGITNISLFLVAPIYPEALIYLIGIPGILFTFRASLIWISSKDASADDKRPPKKIEPQ